MAQLQGGVHPRELVEDLFRWYLVRTDANRVQAYRRLREQMSGYWSLSLLELHHWQFFYEELAAAGAGNVSHTDIIRRFCAQQHIAEQLVPDEAFNAFRRKHRPVAALRWQYPDASVVVDSLPLPVVEAHAAVLRGRTLPALGSTCLAQWRYAMGPAVRPAAK